MTEPVVSGAAPVDPATAAPAEAAAPVVDAAAAPAADAAATPAADAQAAGTEQGAVAPAAKPEATLLGGPQAEGEPQQKEQEQGTEPPANLPTYEAYQIPETLTITNPERYTERMSAFDTKVAALEQKYGIDHESAAAFRQDVLQMGMEEIANALGSVSQATEQARAEAAAEASRQHAEKLQAWKSSFETEFPDATKRSGVLNQAEAIIREYSSDRGHEAAIRQALVETGMANHPAMIRLLSNVAAAMDEGKPVPAQAPTPVASSKAGKLYR